MPRVFILEPYDLPLRNAGDFGELEYVYDENADRPGIWSSEFIPHVLRRLENSHYDPAIDYFVMVGHQVPLALVTCGVAAHSGVIKLLVWSATERQYVARTMGHALV